jgi:hypothetical protein
VHLDSALREVEQSIIETYSSSQEEICQRSTRPSPVWFQYFKDMALPHCVVFNTVSVSLKVGLKNWRLMMEWSQGICCELAISNTLWICMVTRYLNSMKCVYISSNGVFWASSRMLAVRELCDVFL